MLKLKFSKWWSRPRDGAHFSCLLQPFKSLISIFCYCNYFTPSEKQTKIKKWSEKEKTGSMALLESNLIKSTFIKLLWNLHSNTSLIFLFKLIKINRVSFNSKLFYFISVLNRADLVVFKLKLSVLVSQM